MIDKNELEKLLDELVDLDSLYNQKDCLHMYYQLVGVERYLLLMLEEANSKCQFNKYCNIKVNLSENTHKCV